MTTATQISAEIDPFESGARNLITDELIQKDDDLWATLSWLAINGHGQDRDVQGPSWLLQHYPRLREEEVASIDRFVTDFSPATADSRKNIGRVNFNVMRWIGEAALMVNDLDALKSVGSYLSKTDNPRAQHQGWRWVAHERAAREPITLTRAVGPKYKLAGQLWARARKHARQAK